jgi:hypothetical protein
VVACVGDEAVWDCCGSGDRGEAVAEVSLDAVDRLGVKRAGPGRVEVLAASETNDHDAPQARSDGLVCGARTGRAMRGQR